MSTAIILLAAGSGWLYYKEKYGGGISFTSREKPQELEKVEFVAQPADEYDVIVVGTDPEGIAAAVSASRNGLKTLLVDGHDREILGGLMTLGWLNSIDMNYDVENKSIVPGAKMPVLNKGIFLEWYDKVEGDSFDVNTAANAFNKIVQNEELLDLHLKAKAIEPITEHGQEDLTVVEGVSITREDGTVQQVKAKAVIDATQDGDFAAAAGVPFTLGREDLGDMKSQMAVTLVFRLDNVDNEVWKQVRQRLSNDNNPNTGATEMSAWGYDEMQKYPAVNKERLKMRGLNIGRQNDGTILINALQIFGVDPFDPESRAEAFEIAKEEIPHVVKYMKELYPEFANVEFVDTAPELYVRESRHMKGMYRLTILDLLENRDQWDRIGFGSYAVDIQRTSPADNGAVVMDPPKYAIPFRSIVPQKVDNLLVVGRAASFDTLPHGSARVIPTGMATGESAGAAAKIAIDSEMTFRELAESKEDIKKLQDLINSKGMDVQPYTPKVHPYMEHEAYPGLKVAVYLGIAIGGYSNDFRLDDASNPQRFVNQWNIAKRVYPNSFKGDASASIAGIDEAGKQLLTLEQACYTIAKAVELDVARDQAQTELIGKGLLNPSTVDKIKDPNQLTNGDTYMLLKDALERVVGVKF
ncbi:FAD-dependent oxidoreductase [Paenibacillus sp. J2TS4]|uniref:FAD-dependent oxidoreductase n=1 Tax=Paenibacillus sp. J2TS4 TaxID=2807194 RepID=UPI001BCC8A38|nr:FAD-dependent oxidoreductase [Paenibacillus sp. J2TS4]